MSCSSTPPLPPQDPLNRGPPILGVRGPRGCSARALLTPARAFVPAAHKGSKKLRVPSSHSPSHLLSAPPLSAGSSGPRLALAPPPSHPPSSPGPPAPPQLQPQPPGHSARAVRSQRAPPGPGGHCLLSAHNPRPRKRAATNSAAGEAAPGGCGPDARSLRSPFYPAGCRLLLTWRVGAAGSPGRGREGALRAPSRRVRSPSGRGGGLRAAWSCAPAPFVTTAAGTEGLGAVKSVKVPGSLQLGLLLLQQGSGWSPHHGAPASRSRVYSRGRNLVAGFPNELEEGGWVHVLERRFPRPTVRFLLGNSRWPHLLPTVRPRAGTWCVRKAVLQNGWGTASAENFKLTCTDFLSVTSLESFYIFQRVFLVAATNENNADVNGGCLHGKGPNGPRAASVDLRTNECEWTSSKFWVNLWAYKEAGRRPSRNSQQQERAQ